jgi:thymidylate kinase
VRDAYHSLVAADPERWRVVNADDTQDHVWFDVWAAVSSIGLTLETNYHLHSRSTKRGYP